MSKLRGSIKMPQHKLDEFDELMDKYCKQMNLEISARHKFIDVLIGSFRYNHKMAEKRRNTAHGKINYIQMAALHITGKNRFVIADSCGCSSAWAYDWCKYRMPKWMKEHDYTNEIIIELNNKGIKRMD